MPLARRLRQIDPRVLGVVGLFLFALPIYYASLHWRGLSSDDWTHLQTALRCWPTFAPGWTTAQRPLEGLDWMLARALFGIYLPGYHALLATLHLLAACLLYFTLAELLRGRWGLALAASALFMVYPSDQSRFWLSTFAYRFAMVFFLLSVYLAAGARRSHPRRNLALASACFALAILHNEIFLPLGIVPVLLLASVEWRSCKYLLPAAGAFGALATAYLLYRLALPSLLGVYEPKSGVFGATTLAMRTKFQNIFRVNLGHSWLYSCLRIIEGRGQGTLLIGAGVALATGALVLLLFLGAKPRRESAMPWWRPAAMIAVGLVLMVLGYLPIMPTAYGIGIGTISSRVSIAASIGAALTVVGMALLAAVTVSRITRRAWIGEGLLVTGMAALLFVAAMQQYAVRQDYARAWRNQCNVWRQIIAAAPAFKPDAYVIIAGMPGWEGSTRALGTTWEVTAGLQLLFDNPQIRGDVMFTDEVPLTGQEPKYRIRFQPQTFSPRDSTEVFANERLVIFQREPNGKVSLVSTPAWAPAGWSELRTHTEMIAPRPVSPPIRRILQSPFGPPWQAYELSGL